MPARHGYPPGAGALWTYGVGRQLPELDSHGRFQEHEIMLEYVFFDVLPCERFVAFLHERGLEPETQSDGETWEVRLPEELPGELGDAIEEYYDRMLDLNRELHDREAQEDGYHAAGVVVNLSGGETVYAQVDPALLSRIMSVLTPVEFGEVVNAIVDAVENPDTRTMCQRMRGDS